MKSFSVYLALLVALLVTALMPSAVQAQVVYQMGGQQNTTYQVGRQGGHYPQQQYRYERRGNDVWVFLGGVFVGILLDDIIKPKQQPSCPAPQPYPQSQPTYEPAGCDQPVIIQQQTSPQQPVVVNQNTTVVVVDGVATATTTNPTPRPAQGITGAVTLAPWGMDITVPTTKPVSVGNQIWFIRSGQVTGKFAVKAISGQTATLEYISGAKPTDGDGFAIVYP
jgi:hypothetical protein